MSESGFTSSSDPFGDGYMKHRSSELQLIGSEREEQEFAVLDEDETNEGQEAFFDMYEKAAEEGPSNETFSSNH